MLWTSLRFGWGNTGPVILFGFLPLLAATIATIERQPALPAAIMQSRCVEVDPAADLLGPKGRVSALEARDVQSARD